MVDQTARKPGRPGKARSCRHSVSKLYLSLGGKLRCSGCNADNNKRQRAQLSRKNPDTHNPDEREDFTTYYPDTGCEVSLSCLECPLPQCKYDDPVWYQKRRRLAGDLKMLSTMESEGLTIEEAAERFGVTIRTIFRIKQRVRLAGYVG